MDVVYCAVRTGSLNIIPETGLLDEDFTVDLLPPRAYFDFVLKLHAVLGAP